MNVHLNANETITFLQEVEKYPCLHDSTYNSTRQEKHRAWIKISETMLLPPSACKSKWITLRNKMMKLDHDTPYRLEEYIQFLKLPDVATKNCDRNEESPDEEFKSISSIKIELESEASDDGQYTDSPEVKRKKLLPQTEKENINDKNKRLSTVKSIICDLSLELGLMNSDQFKLFKRKVFTLIDEVLTEDD